MASPRKTSTTIDPKHCITLLHKITSGGFISTDIIIIATFDKFTPHLLINIIIALVLESLVHVSLNVINKL